MLFHAHRITPSQQLIALHPRLRVDIESINCVLPGLILAVIKMTPRSQHLMPVSISHHRKHLRLRHARRNLCAPHRNRLPAILQPSRRPRMLPQVVVQRSEVCRRVAVAAIVIQHTNSRDEPTSSSSQSTIRRFVPSMMCTSARLANDTLQTENESRFGVPCTELRFVVITSAWSYCTPISRIVVHFCS